ncbi:hypothetical protein JG688_00010827 [Phytophthora aleatoria]|uniref:DDE Tnp4 domain-containing protein n=1 Tax=Phytophthora aleatoria TaxID=2496075 RepID=A0A8J5IVN8_9STRA|nr:hypothetical protein JG688_00010827 [Phytophthora aleatoria]
MLRESKLLPYLASHPIVQRLGVVIYGGPAYGVDELLCRPFHNAVERSSEKRLNEIMSKNRVSIEWVFGIIKGQWTFLDWNKKHDAIFLMPVAHMVRVMVLQLMPKRAYLEATRFATMLTTFHHLLRLNPGNLIRLIHC